MNNLSSRLTRAIEYLLIAVPFLILIPRTNTPADPLTPNSLPSQEFTNLFICSILLILVSIQVFREGTGSLRVLSRNLCMVLLSLCSFCAWQALTLFWTPTVSEGIRVLSQWVVLSILLTIGWLYLSVAGLNRLFISIAVASGLLAVYQIFLYEQSGIAFTGLLYSFYLKTELLALVLPLLIVGALSIKKTWLRILTIGSAAASWLVEMQMFKRGPLIGLLIAFIVLGFGILFSMKFESKKGLIITISVIGIIAAAQIVQQSTYFKERIQDATNWKTSGGSTSELSARLHWTAIAIEMFKANPLLGDGNGAYNADYAKYRQSFFSKAPSPFLLEVHKASEYAQYNSNSTNAHNEYVQMLAELGLIGFVLFIVVCFFILSIFWKTRSDLWSLGAMCGLLAYAVSSAFTSFSLRAAPGSILVACMLVVGTRHEETTSSVFSLPETAKKTIPIFFLLICSFLTWCSFSVMRSYQIEREVAFMYDPQDPDKNRSYLAEHQRALSWDSKNVSANLGYGVMLYQMHQPKLAIPHIEYAIKHAYNRPWSVSLLAYCYEQTREFDKAIVYLDDCIAAFPKSIYAKSVRAEMLRKKGVMEEYKKQKDEIANTLEAKVWDIALRNTNEKTDAEIKSLGVRQLYDIGEPTGIPPQPFKLEQLMVQMRAFHYLK